VEPVLVAAYVAELQRHYGVLSVKQHLAAIRVLFDYLVTGGVLRVNPAASVDGQTVTAGCPSPRRSGRGRVRRIVSKVVTR
jgi:site-specific recombinase XerC